MKKYRLVTGDGTGLGARSNFSTLHVVDRLNSEGILIDDLPTALRSRRVVMTARRMDSCLLCRRKGVNEAGICTYCYSSLDGEAANLASKWLSGIGP